MEQIEAEAYNYQIKKQNSKTQYMAFYKSTQIQEK